VRLFKADLHIHTALSPCAMEEMTPPAIVEEAIRKGLHMIAVCDHNAAGNAASTQEAAGTALAAVAGMEITTAEDIHVLGLFPDAASACRTAEVVRAGLPTRRERSRKFGQQLLLNARGETLGAETKMLAASSALSLADAIKLIKNNSGLALAAHANRQSFSVLSQLGLFPPDAGFDAIEIFPKARLPSDWDKQRPQGVAILQSSDSHCLSEIGSCFTMFELAESSFGELVFAIKGVAGRRCRNA
jgi:predicted metal-dependent phosphoesterase TrpH